MVRRDGQSPRPGWLSDDSIPPSRQSRLFLKKNIYFTFSQGGVYKDKSLETHET